MDAKENDGDGYEEMLLQIPEKWRNHYNKLVLMAAMYTIVMFDVRRGREGKRNLLF